jgi:two-component system, cell cycle sensor histidine kinase and response regulator CckA
MADRFYELIRHLHIGVVVQGPSTEVLVCNPAALELLGLDEDQYRGKTSYDPDWNIVREDGTPFEAQERPIATVLATGRPVRNVVMGVFRPKRRDRVWLLVNAQPELDAAGCIVEVVATLIDITERKQLESSLIEARKLESIGRLAGGIAHDFNNLLAVITGATSLAMEMLPVDAPAREELALSLDAAHRAAGLTAQLLTFARRRELSSRACDVAAVVTSIERLLTRVAGAHVAVEIAADPATGWTLMDPVELEQILVNLTANARDAMPSGGTLSINTRPVSLALDDGTLLRGKYARIEVADTGEGMDEATRSKIFEPFFTTKGPGHGTGLGLATVHGIVHQHGGQISVDSALGRGTRIVIHLRRSDEPIVATPSPKPAQPRGHETILVVEDERALLLLARRMLEKLGYVVLTARNGSDALRVADAYAGTIHLLFTDLTMPEMNGTRLATALRERRPNLRVLITSGYTEDRRLFEDAWEVLDKPYVAAQLASRIRAILDRP